MSLDIECPVALIIARDDDPWNALAHYEHDSDNDNTSNASSAATSAHAISVAEVSLGEPSVVTRPTSYGTIDPGHHQHYEGKINDTYAASISATCGSGSEEEFEHNDTVQAALLGTGAWLTSRQAEGCIRRHENARIRLSKTLPDRVKKPSVVLHQIDRSTSAFHHDPTPSPMAISMSDRENQKCPFHRMPPQHYIMLGLVCLMLMTVSLSGYIILNTYRAKTALRRHVLLAATVLSLQTAITMLTARRSFLQVLCSALFPLLTGSMLMLFIDSLA